MEKEPDRRAGTALKAEGAHSPWAWASNAPFSARLVAYLAKDGRGLKRMSSSVGRAGC